MTYATVMVGLAVDQSNEAPLEIAGQLAERFGASVIGVTAAEFSPPLYFEIGRIGKRLIDGGRAGIKNGIAQVEGEFRPVMHNRVTELEWRFAEIFRPGTSFSKRGPAILLWWVGLAAALSAIPSPSSRCSLLSHSH